MSARTFLCFARENCWHRSTCARANYPDGVRPSFGDLSESCLRSVEGSKEKSYIHFLDFRKPQTRIIE